MTFLRISDATDDVVDDDGSDTVRARGFDRFPLAR